MRVFLGFAVLMFGVSGILAASAQPFTPVATDQFAQAVVRSGKGDRISAPTDDEALDRARLMEAAKTAFAAALARNTAVDSEAETVPADSAGSAEATTEAGSVHRISLDEFCEILVSSARSNDLPIVFFSNLIWQESRFNANSVSRAGAQGIARFMPETAATNGLDNPFNPYQAVPASARLLHQLQEQFGNVGLAAAAYNAGPGRIIKWLARRASLPRETRAYVVTITGRPAEHWRVARTQTAFKPARDLPCSHTAAFAELEVAEAQQVAQNERSEPAEASKPGTATRTTIGKATIGKTIKNRPRRLALRGALKTRPKAVQLTLVVPEPGQAATRSKQKKTTAGRSRGRSQRKVRVASTSS